MSERLVQDDTIDVIRDLIRRVEALETSSRLARSSIRDGVLKLIDSNGALRAQLGKLTAAGGSGDRWGIEVLKQPGSGDWPDGEPFFRATEDGAEFPYGVAPAIDENSGAIGVTSSSFVVTFSGAAGIVMHKRVAIMVWVTTAPDTTGEIRITRRGGASSPAVAFGTSTNEYVSVPAWEHDATLWTGPVIFDLEARRTAGTGFVAVRWPVTGFIFQPR